MITDATNNAICRDTLLVALHNHIGKRNGVTATALCREILHREPAGLDERHLREIVVELRTFGHHVCATTTDGYYLAATPEELDETCLFLHGRAMCSLVQVAAMKRVSAPDLRGQLKLPT
jgi:hypothetical protein